MTIEPNPLAIRPGDHFPRTSLASEPDPKEKRGIPVFSPTHSDLLETIKRHEELAEHQAKVIRKQNAYIHNLEELLRGYGHSI